MLKNYLKIAVRNLVKNKIFSFINIIGLAMGLACCMLIAVFIYDELSYDKYPQQASNIYRVELNVTGNGKVETYPNVDVAVGQGIKNNFPDVLAFARLVRDREKWVKYGDKQFKEKHLAFADSNFLEMFSIPFLEGDVKTALKEPNSIVITKAFAMKYFGNDEALGKPLSVGKGDLYKVTGVIDKIPDNSHFHKDAFMSLSSLPDNRRQTWSNIGWFTYLLLNPNADAKKLEAKFPNLVSKYVVSEVQHDMGVSLAEAQKSANTFRFSLQPLTDIHLHSDTKYELEANGDIRYVYIFGALAVFILLLACVNFTNLSVAISTRRAREVGLRKVVGSTKSQLVFQFLAESIFLSFCAVFIASVLVWISLPYFNELSGKHISFLFFLRVPSIAALIVLSLIVGVLAGIYPAFFLSSFNTIHVLKGSSPLQGNRKNILRSGSVVFQFTVSSALIIATLLVYQQLHYMQNKKTGYDIEQVMYIEDTYLLGENESAFREQLLQDSRVIKASIGRGIPGNSDMDGTQISPKEKTDNENSIEIHANIYHVDEQYLPTLGIQVAKGRNFSKFFSTDSSAVIINEAAVRELGWNGTDPIGKTITASILSGHKQYKVIGVVADFHYASAKQKIAPLLMMFGRNSGGIFVKIKTKEVQRFLVDVKKQWDAYKTDGSFSYYFLDDSLVALYIAEQRTANVFTVFASLSILIAGLGLLGLAAFITEQRTKEIGIRKILGASVSQVFVLVSKEFLVLVSLAFIISIPLTAWLMHTWLQDFAYRITVSVQVFLIAGVTSISIALLAVSFQVIKAAIANPIKSLRTE